MVYYVPGLVNRKPGKFNLAGVRQNSSFRLPAAEHRYVLHAR
jgi:hypothetical protein